MSSRHKFARPAKQQASPVEPAPCPPRRPFLDVDAVDVSGVVAAADAFLRDNATYQTIGSPQCFGHVWGAWGLLCLEVQRMGLTGRALRGGMDERANGLALLRTGVHHQCEAIDESPFAHVTWNGGKKTTGLCVLTGEAFVFDATALLEIEHGARLLRNTAPPEKVDGPKEKLVPPIVPVWDKTRQQLCIGPDSFQFRRYAPAQFAVLDAFHKENWRTEIKNPLSHFNIKSATDELNKKLAGSRLRFSRHNRDNMVLWCLTP
jgi:hypothetical protein